MMNGIPASNSRNQKTWMFGSDSFKIRLIFGVPQGQRTVHISNKQKGKKQKQMEIYY